MRRVLDLINRTLNPKPQTLNPKPETPNPKTLNPKTPKALNPRYDIFGYRRAWRGCHGNLGVQTGT